MRLIIIAILIPFHFCSYGQNTYSKLVDLGIAKDNFLTDLEISDQSIYISSSHLCQDDTSSNDFYSCTGISKFDRTGVWNNSILLDSLHPEGNNRLLLSENTLFLTGHYREDFNGRATILLEFDTNLKLDSVYSIMPVAGEIPNNEGIIEFDSAFYLYGTKLAIDENKKYSNIIKLNSQDKSVAWNKTFFRAKRINECFDLQGAVDGSLVFMQYFSDGAGSGGESGFQIVKIDTKGNAIDTFEFEDIDIGNPRLLASKEGDIYFSSQDPPYPHTFPTNGRINKIDLNLDSLEWSLALPSDPFHDAHRYKIYDCIQALNGDVIACGTVWEEGPDGPLGTPNNHTWNGFIVRVNQSGQIQWLKIYRHPNNHPLLPIDDFGEFRSSLLLKLFETTDGNFIAGGSVYYDSYQDASLPFDENKSSIWLMLVDRNGCIDDEECSETIILDGVNDLSFNFHIGTNWTYEVEVTPFPVFTTSQTFMITDTSTIDSIKVFVIENDFDLSKEYMHVEGTKVFFWDNALDTFQLNYDFAEVSQYQIPWAGYCDSESGSVNVNIDTIAFLLINQDSIKVQHLSIQEEGSKPLPLLAQVYNKVGLANGGLRIPLGLGFCDFNRYLTKLRCFNSDFVSYQFVDYPCDSTWFSTSTTSIKTEQPVIYPNPSNGVIQILPIDRSYMYELFDVDGRLLLKGDVLNSELNFTRKGLFFVRLFDGQYLFMYRIIIQ